MIDWTDTKGVTHSLHHRRITAKNAGARWFMPDRKPCGHEGVPAFTKNGCCIQCNAEHAKATYRRKVRLKKVEEFKPKRFDSFVEGSAAYVKLMASVDEDFLEDSDDLLEFFIELEDVDIEILPDEFETLDYVEGVIAVRKNRPRFSTGSITVTLDDVHYRGYQLPRSLAKGLYDKALGVDSRTLEEYLLGSGVHSATIESLASYDENGMDLQPTNGLARSKGMNLYKGSECETHPKAEGIRFTRTKSCVCCDTNENLD